MSKFVAHEKELLAEICQNYPVLIDKGYSMEIVSNKQKAWVEIRKKFNALNPGRPPRDVSQLRGLWKRLKLKMKADLDAYKRGVRRTGREAPTPPLTKPERILAGMFSGDFYCLPDTIDDEVSPFQEGPGEESEMGEEEMIPQVAFSETLSWPSKKRNSLPQGRLLEMAEEQHREKMEILKYKKECQRLKLLLLQKECKTQNVIH